MAQVCVPWGEINGIPHSICANSPEGFGTGEGFLSNLGTILTGGAGRVGLMTYVFAISGLILLFMIVASGYTLLTSAGNPDAIGKAKSRLTAAVTGFLIVFAAFWIYQLVGLLLATPFAP